MCTEVYRQPRWCLLPAASLEVMWGWTLCVPSCGCFKRPLPWKGNRSARRVTIACGRWNSPTFELAVVLAAPQNDAATRLSWSLNLTRLQKSSEMMRPPYNQHSLTCKQDNGTWIFHEVSDGSGCSGDLHQPQPMVQPSQTGRCCNKWTISMNFSTCFLWLCHQSLPVGIMLRAVDAWAPKKRSPFTTQTVLPFRCSKTLVSFVLVQMQETSETTLARVCQPGHYRSILLVALGSEIACILDLKQTYTC